MTEPKTLDMSAPRRTAPRRSATHLEPVTGVPFWSGVGTVARLDLRQRLRTSRTKWVLLAWVVAVYGFVGLTWLATHAMSGRGQAESFYGVTMFVVLALALLVAPSLSASAISGDRSDGVLASLQVTLLSPAQIALGKFLASWAAALGFLGIASPVLLGALLAGGVTAGSLGLGLLTLALVTGTVCAIGLAVSALTARVVSSVAMTYVVLGFLVIGTPLLFGLTLPLTETTGDVRVLRNDTTNWTPGPSNQAPPCVEQTVVRTRVHTERTWWFLAANPFVIVADAAPGVVDVGYGPIEPLGGIREGVRQARHGTPEPVRECWNSEFSPGSAGQRADRGLEDPVWPIGFAGYAAVGAGALAIAVRRLRTPVRTLPRGTRIA